MSTDSAPELVNTAWSTGQDGTKHTASAAPSASVVTYTLPTAAAVDTTDDDDDDDDDADSALPSPSGPPPPTSAPASGSAAPASPDQPYLPHQPKSLAGIALRSFCLGIALALGLVLTVLALVVAASPLWRLPFFLAALSAFHFLEFWTTAAYNTPAATVGSFLLTANWPAYAVAHAAASLECLVVGALFPSRAWAPLGSGRLLLLLGLACVVVGQAVRSAAMVRAGRSFNHVVQHKRGSSHTLVTTGIYGVFRHPSYFGFFWWALGTQLVLGNVVCFVAYAAVLWRFFSTRIRHEEGLLTTFFGEEYVDYSRRVGTKIPLIP